MVDLKIINNNEQQTVGNVKLNFVDPQELLKQAQALKKVAKSAENPTPKKPFPVSIFIDPVNCWWDYFLLETTSDYYVYPFHNIGGSASISYAEKEGDARSTHSSESINAASYTNYSLILFSWSIYIFIILK